MGRLTSGDLLKRQASLASKKKMITSRLTRACQIMARRMSTTTLKNPATPTEPVKDSYKGFLDKKNYIGLDKSFVHLRNEVLVPRNYVMYALTAAGVTLAVANM